MEPNSMTCITPIFVRRSNHFVPCGKCAFCLKKAIDAWCLRIYHEMADSSSAYFFTLTYATEHLPANESLDKEDVQKFMRALRQRHKGIRYFAVGEYGTERGRPHYHAIIFNLPDDWNDIITKSWYKGFVSGSRAVMGRVRYMVEYMALPAQGDWGGREKPFRLMSRRPGIGHSYLEKQARYHRKKKDSVVYVFDSPNAMPRYYKDKIYTNQHDKAAVQKNALDYTERHPSSPCPVQHERLLKKLNKKHR